MIVQQRLSGTDLVITYSDAGKLIEQIGTGYRYAGAIDPDYMNRQYIETEVELTKEELESLSREADDHNVIARMAAMNEDNEALRESNRMLTECVLEMSEVLYT